MHGNSGQTDRNGRGMRFEQKRLIHPLMLNIFLLGSLGGGKQDGIVSFRQQRHDKCEIRGKHFTGPDCQRMIQISEAGVVAEQFLTELVVDVKPTIGE